MANKLKNHNLFHATINGKTTLCGLPNGYIADNIEKFTKYVKDEYYYNVCCKKCQTKINQ
jgi:hypothetical protein